MPDPIHVRLEEDPVPIVMIIGRFLTNQLRHPGPLAAANRMAGVIALRSTTDPQAVTLRLLGGEIIVSRGVSKQADLVVHLDFNRMSDPAMKPRVEGLLRHPVLALRLQSLMADVPTPEWTREAPRFWALVAGKPGIPGAIRLTDTEQEREVLLGEGEPEMEIEGPTAALAALVSGNVVLLQEVVGNGHLRVRSGFEALCCLSELTLQMLLGELVHD